MRKLYPDVSLLFLDFDGGTSEANVFNRLHFLIENPDFDSHFFTSL